MKKPQLDLGPKLNRPMAQPQAMITRGVRQVERPEAGRRPPADMRFSLLFLGGAGIGVRVGYGELMHVHEKPNLAIRKKSHRIAAMQIRAGCFDELATGASSRAQGAVLF